MLRWVLWQVLLSLLVDGDVGVVVVGEATNSNDSNTTITNNNNSKGLAEVGVAVGGVVVVIGGW